MEWLHKFLVWRIKHISDSTFLTMLGILVGVIAGLAAVTLKLTVHLIEKFLTSDLTPDHTGLMQSFYPLIGIVVTVVIAKYLLNEQLGHGITAILYRISKRSSIISRKKTYSRMVTSALTVGFGGSVGLEAPIVLTGSDSALEMTFDVQPFADGAMIVPPGEGRSVGSSIQVTREPGGEGRSVGSVRSLNA